MPTADSISGEFAKLTDEELIARLRSGDLTQIALDAAHRELAERGIDVARVLAQPARVPVSPSGASSALARCIGILTRILGFPVRAVLGLEPPWAVIVFGVVFVYLVFQSIRYGLVQLFLSVHPPPPYFLSVAYAGTALIALAMAWFALALWRGAKQAKAGFWRLVVRILAAVSAVNTVFATLRLVPLMQEYFSSPPGSVMDTLPKS